MRRTQRARSGALRPYDRGVRWLVALLVLVGLVLGAVVAAGEWVLRPATERAMAADLARSYGLPTLPDVRLRGFPFAAAVITGRLDGVTVNAEGFSVDGLAIRSARLEARDVRVDPSSVLARQPTGTAEAVGLAVTVGDEAFSTYLVSRGVPLSLRVEGGGRVVVAGEVDVGGFVTRGSASGPLDVRNGVASFRPEQIDLGGVALPGAVASLARAAFSFDVAVPDVTGVRLSDVDFDRPGQLILRADVTEAAAFVLAGRSPDLVR